MTEVKITYETLFDLLRREKSRDELQELDPSFYSDVLEYIKQKQAILDEKGDQSELFKASEAEKTKIQLQNIKRILKELYDKREKKILNTAMNKARTGSSIIDTTALLDEEKKLFNQVAELLSRHRNEILNKLIALEGPGTVQDIPRPPEGEVKQSNEAASVSGNEISDTQNDNSDTRRTESSSAQKQEVSDAPKQRTGGSLNSQKAELSGTQSPKKTLLVEETSTKDKLLSEKEEVKPEEEIKEGKAEVEETPVKEEVTEEKKEELPAEEVTEKEEEVKEEMKTIRFLSPLPRFVGKQLETYGPFDEGETAELPKIIANILVDKGRAEEIKE